jgi:predicted nicotinamide N-methyase
MPLYDAAALVRACTGPRALPLLPELRLHLSPALTPVWEALAAAGPSPAPPWWAVAWPGGQALARLLLDRPELVRGRRVFELGCGCGISAIAAARAGAARVVAVDLDPCAVVLTLDNARRNGVEVEALAVDPLRRPPPDADVVLAGDMCYERAAAGPLLRWLQARADAGATVLLADPGRGLAPTAGLPVWAEHRVQVDDDTDPEPFRTVRVVQLRPTAA